MDNEQKNPVAKIPQELIIPVGEVIRNWREFRGLSITELAEMAKLSKGYISQVENDKIKRPSDQQLAKLAGALEIEVWDIIARRMPGNQATTKGPTTSDTKNKEGVSQDSPLPFEAGAFYYPQEDDSDIEAVVEDLRRLLSSSGLDHEQRAAYLELISSFIAWLEFRVGSAK